MALHRLLTDRKAINILKQLYEHERENKNSYAIKLSQVPDNISIKGDKRESALILSKEGLIGLDCIDDDYVISITNKGKEFIEIFDQLVDLFRPEHLTIKPIEKKVRIKYELTNMEKKILLMTQRISKETGMEFIGLNTITQELFPYEDHKRKTSTVSRQVSKLEEINLIERKKEGRASYVKVTDKGLKTIKEQYLKELMR